MKIVSRESLSAALALPLPQHCDDLSYLEFFNPWDHVLQGIHGGYSKQSDDLLIETLEAVRDGKTFELMRQHGFAAEFMLYVLSGHGMTEYGTSPRGGWPAPGLLDLWQPLIDKLKAYREVAW